MRSHLSYLFTLSIILFLASCQVIPEAERYQYVGELDTTMERHVLLVDITGYLCVNCPEAAKEAHQLQEQYPNNLVVVELHPSVNSFTKYTKAEYNYTSDVGDYYFALWGGTKTTPNLPAGVVNFDGEFREYLTWASQVTTCVQKNDTLSPLLSMKVEKDAASRVVKVNAELHNTDGSAFTTQATVLLWLVEDSIIGPQQTTSGTVMEYAHNHVLRASLTESFDGIKSTNGKCETVTYTIPEKYNWQNCSVVGVLLSPADNSVCDAQQLFMSH